MNLWIKIQLNKMNGVVHLLLIKINPQWWQEVIKILKYLNIIKGN